MNKSAPDAAADDLADQAEPLAGAGSLDVAVDDIPKPPAELIDELDNDGVGATAAEVRTVEVATLDFCGDELPYRDFPLKYPFKWQGERVDTITVRQLTTQQMGEISREAARKETWPPLFDVYAKMTGLPAEVLRALPSIDGDPITVCAFDFLPPLLRPESG